MLDGLRVLDLTRVLAGPLCTMILGDLGADVIKVERPGAGDDTRGWGPPFDERGRSAYFLSINRNKLSIACDLEAAADRDLLLRLIREADVVVDNFRPGTLERRGIDPDRLTRERERLVWCTITGFGAESERPGYDFAVQAEAGWMAITGEPTGDPMKVGVALADVIAGKDAAIAILGALVARQRETRGRRLFISLLASAQAALVNVAQNALVTGVEASRWGNAHPNLAPYQLFHASDRPLVVAVGSDAQWRACARALGLESLADDPGLATNADRVARRAEIVAAMARVIRTAEAATWQQRLAAVHVPTGLVREILEVVREAAGSPVSGMPSSVGGSVRLDPPGLDEHGDLIRRSGWAACREVPKM